MVQAVRRGKSLRRVARDFGTSLETVRRWVERARSTRLDRVDWSDRPAGAPRPVNRTSAVTEEDVLRLRSELTRSDLGDAGADAIRAAMIEQQVAAIPSRRTIGRILLRRGILDGRARVRRPPPPIGWYLPKVASADSELDSFDTVEGLILRGGIELTVLNGISVHGGLISCWPRESIAATDAVELLTSRWREFGLPSYAQFDNATIFQGPHQHRDVVGQVMRTCLLLGITPVFAPPREPGFQNAVESLNGRWQTKVWRRFEHASLADLALCSDRWRTATAIRHASRSERAPSRRPFPVHFVPDLQAHPSGLLIFIRRTDDHGFASLLGHRFLVAAHWAHRLVRSEVDLQNRRIRFFALRRREPLDQPLLSEHSYSLPSRRFRLRSS
jgi:transposase-like protein